MVPVWTKKCRSQVGKHAFINDFTYLKLLRRWNRLFLSFALNVHFHFQTHPVPTAFTVIPIIWVISQPGDAGHELKKICMNPKQNVCLNKRAQIQARNSSYRQTSIIKTHEQSNWCPFSVSIWREQFLIEIPFKFFTRNLLPLSIFWMNT